MKLVKRNTCMRKNLSADISGSKSSYAVTIKFGDEENEGE
jgi:hypothetical protein